MRGAGLQGVRVARSTPQAPGGWPTPGTVGLSLGFRGRRRRWRGRPPGDLGAEAGQDQTPRQRRRIDFRQKAGAPADAVLWPTQWSQCCVAAFSSPQ